MPALRQILLLALGRRRWPDHYRTWQRIGERCSSSSFTLINSPESPVCRLNVWGLRLLTGQETGIEDPLSATGSRRTRRRCQLLEKYDSPTDLITFLLLLSI